MPRSGRDADLEPDCERFEELLVADESEFCDLLECVLGLTEPVADAYRYVLAQPDCTVKELSRAMDCDPSTVNRRLETLREKGLVSRHHDLLSGGGIVYRYEATPLDRVEERLHRTLDEWAASMHERIETARSDLESST